MRRESVSEVPLVHLDDIDRSILLLLRADARRTVRDIAERVGLTVAPVKRRIDRLEGTGVIEGYTVRVNSSRVDSGMEAIVELRVAGDMDLDTILSFSSHLPEVREVLTLAGDPDALVRVRAATIQELQRVVNALRTNGRVTGTKTLVVLGNWRSKE